MSTGTDHPTIKCFISYSHHDVTLVMRIATDLRSYGIDVWLDEWKLHAGDSITDGIQTGLKGCDVVIVMLSPAALKSRWVHEELRIAYWKRVASQAKLVPIVLSDVGPSLPELLRDYKALRFEPGEVAYEESLTALLNTLVAGWSIHNRDRAKMSVLNHLIDVHIEIRGNNHELATFRERRRFRPLLVDWELRTEIVVDGVLLDASATGFRLERIPIRRSAEAWILRPLLSAVTAGDVDGELCWVVRDEFEIERSWYYALDAPTRQIRVTLAFENAVAPPAVTCSLTRSVTEVQTLDVARMDADGVMKFSVDLLHPPWGYRFQFRW